MDKEVLGTAVQQDHQTVIEDLIKSHISPGRMRQRIADFHPSDVADVLPLLSEQERSRFYGMMELSVLAEILEYSDEISRFLGELSLKKRLEVLSRLEPSVAASYLKELEKKECASLLELMPEDFRRDISLLTSFDEDEIGSHMSTNLITIRRGMSVREAMHALIEQAAENDNVSTVYVVDEQNTYWGAIALKDLIIAREGNSLDAITRASYPYFYATESVESCLERMRDYQEDSIPILDAENRLQGVLTAQDAAELIDEEISEDYAKLAGLAAAEDLNEPLRKSISKRLPWLAILLVLSMGVSVVVGLFESVVASLAVIVSFQSLILGMAGNAGTQSLAITIRVLTDESLTPRQRWGLLGKEARVASCNGLIMGLLSFCLVGAYLYFLKGEPATLAFSVSACTGIALLVAMFLSGIAGTLIPMLFKMLKFDPAVASGPLITTLNDLVAVVSYYGLAWLLLIHTLGL